MSGRVVKSAARVIQLLEYFDEIRSGASVMEVSRALNYPQSSTSGLLKSLTHLGYLAYDPYERIFTPTHRVSLLGSWIKAPSIRGDSVINMMEELGERTHETVVLGEQTGVIVRYIYVVPSRQVVRLHLRSGMIRPLATSGMGRLFLSTYPEDRVKDLLRRINADPAPGEPIIRYAEIKPDLDEIRRRGYAVSVNRITPGAGVVTAMLPSMPDFPPLAVAIGGFSETISRSAERFAEMMLAAFRRNLP